MRRQRCTRLRLASHLTIIFSFGLFLTPSVLTAQTCSGNAASVFSQTGVDSLNNALGAADVKAANLWDTGDQLALDLGDRLAAGSTIVVRWKGNLASTADPVVTVETSQYGSSFVAVTGSPFTVARSASYFNQNITVPTNTRYVRFTTTNAFNLDLDAVTFTTQSCAPIGCYTITNPSAAQTLCEGVTGSNVTVNTNVNSSGGVRFAYYATDKMAGSTPTAAESNALYGYTSGYKDLTYVTPTGSSAPYTATYPFSATDFPNNTNAPITYYLYVLFNEGSVNLNCAIKPVQEIQITIKPRPNITSIADQFLCAGTASSAATLTGSTVSSTTYAWTNSTTSIGLAASGTTTIPSFTATNATLNPVTATIGITATANGCSSETATSKIIVYPTSASMISGTAFNDFNENGIREGAEGVQEGIEVKVYNANNVLLGTTMTNASGYWAVSGLTFGGANDKYRVEFSIPPPLSNLGLKPAKRGSNNGTDVQFVSAASCAVNFGVNYKEAYCSTNPVLATPCYTNGSRVSNPNDAAVVLFKYDERGQGVPHESVATIGEVGAVWGEAYNPVNKKLYVSAFVKRHVDLSPNGLGAIYEIDMTTPTAAGAGTPTLWLDINAATFVNQNNVAVNLGFPADPGIATRDLGVKTNPSRDNWAFDYVGKQGIADIELSQDGRRLYVMDLTNRQVLCIDYTTKKLIWKLPVSTPTCLGGSTDIRPWALKEYKGVLYVGAVCSGETNKLSTDLHYYVMQCNSLTAATSMSLAVDMGSARNKQDLASWRYWAANATDAGIAATAHKGYMTAAQPVVSDIEFDKEGNMMIGVMDRFGHQSGEANYVPNVSNTNLAYGVAFGDVTRAVKSASTYTIEAAPWSFFYIEAAIPNPPKDQFMGGLLTSSVSGDNYLTLNMIDPFDFESNGIQWLKTSDGQRQGGTNAESRLEIVPRSTTAEFFGKANGLGDLQMLCSTAPIEIGNRVWYDANKDGVQDATEGPLSNIALSLWKNGTQIASTTTDANGNYAFSSKSSFLTPANWTGTGADTAILANTAYEIRIDTTNQTRLDTVKLANANATANNGNDQNDSDASVSGNYAVINLTTGEAGSTSHAVADFGFRPLDCALNLTTNVSDCFDSNANATGGTSQATVQVIVNWVDAIGSNLITVNLTGATAQTVNPATAAKPAILNFTVPANGATLTVAATYVTCAANKTVTAPAGNCLQTPCVAGNTGGTVWRDLNNNGVKDAAETAGVSSVAVTAYDCNGNVAATTTTDALGQYTFTTLTPSATNKYRFEFSNIPPQYQPTFNGTNGRTDVQIIAAATCSVNYGVNNPADYCQANPQLITPCYVDGATSGTGPSDVLVKWSYNNVGEVAGDKSVVATKSQIGSTWGVAYNRKTQKVYTAAFLKRHVGMGPNGLGAIYETDPIAATSTLFVDVATLLGGPNSLGTMMTNAARGLTNAATPTNDPSVYDDIYKKGLGDMDISEDNTKLYAVDLFNKQIVVIDIASKTLLSTIPIPDPNCSGGSMRPFGLKVYNGDLYAGVICDAAASQNAADMKATVYKYAAATGTPTAVINFPLNYPKGYAASLDYFGGTCEDITGWLPWNNAFPSACFGTNLIMPQPILADIEFDVDGSMIMAFNDRFGHQVGFVNYGLTGTTTYITAVGGDILRASAAGNGQYILEKNGSVGSLTSNGGVGNGDGPDGGEFYVGDRYIDSGNQVGHSETVVGGLLLLPAKNEVAVICFDPVDVGTVNSGGVQKLSNVNGTKNSGFRIFVSPPSGSSPTFGKANGLGDLEALCDAAPIQVGNYVWYDQDRDGVQDPCEQPLSNIAVSLWKAGVQIASTTTNANGEYYFSSKFPLGAAWTGTGADTILLANTAYEIRIDTTNQTRLDTVKLTSANATANNGNDQNDSDAAVTGNYAVIAFTTGAAGATKQNYDFGFSPLCDTTLTVSNTTVCNGSSVNLFAQASGVKGTLTYSTNGTTWTALANPTNVTPSVSTTYFVKDTLSGGCFDVDTLTITVHQPVTAGVGTNPTTATCQAGSGLSNINLAGQITGATSGGTWSQTSGTAVGTALNTATGVFNPNGIAIGTYTFRYTVTGTSPCPSATTDITITIENCCPSSLCLPVSVVRN